MFTQSLRFVIYFRLMKTEEAKELGIWGEVQAQNMMREMGMQIVEVNWKFLHLEIDIVAMDGDQLVICEVKTRSTLANGNPEMFVNRTKQRKLMRAANLYLEQQKLTNEIRFDVVGIIKQGRYELKNYVKDAFSAVA